ncbi:ras-related protein ORAB-1-like [Ylistrum balloti]|uniref:ras-related protein ORAB-1-like n=1 Tax=Ylistrum balloti TaxID=509963 RepID=UPI002905E074|nr:ras-related protein ORAB-1-like [Ylistrum balloti]
MNNNNGAARLPRPYETIHCRERTIFLNLMLLGDYNAGKTCFIQRFVEGTFVQSGPTYGCDFFIKNVWIDRSEIKLRLWDTYGGERYRGPGSAYYRQCHGVIVMYDVTNMSSFDNIEKIWLKNIEQHASDDLVVILVGTKCDLPDRQVDYVTAKSFADKLNIPLMETSSLTGYGVDRIVISAAAMALDKILQNASSIKEYFPPIKTTNARCNLS